MKNAPGISEFMLSFSEVFPVFVEFFREDPNNSDTFPYPGEGCPGRILTVFLPAGLPGSTPGG